MAQGTRQPSTQQRRHPSIDRQDRVAAASYGGRRRVTACLLAFGLLAAACGGDRGSGGEAAPTTAATGGSTTAPTEGGGTTFGTLDSPCGEGDAKGATATGVTDDSITIGYGDDAGYAAAPGLDKEISDAMKPMIDWCNEQGGINGRTVEGNYYDAKAIEVNAAITQACNDEIFMLVGQGWVLDSGAEQARIECEIASIPAFTVSTTAAHGPGTAQPLPNPGDQLPASAAYEMAELFPDAVKKAAFVFAEFPATRETRDKYEAAYPAAGWEFEDCDQIYGIAGEADWKPFASNLKDCGIEAVVWVGSPNPNFQNFLAASQQVGFEPTAYLSDTSQYDTSFAEWSADSGGAGDNVYIRMSTVPFEQADKVPAVQQYIDIVDAAGGKKAVLGVHATSAFLLWATATKACGSDVTQSCVLAEVARQKEWTAGGLHGATDPAANESSRCGALLKLNGGDFEQVVPEGDETFDCKDEYLATGITTDALTAAKLDGDRVSTENGTFTPK